jgi:hypothetical protein
MDKVHTIERPITWEDVAGKTFWDDKGASFKAERVKPEIWRGREWIYVACNLKALATGYYGQPLRDFYLPEGMLNE